MTAKLWEDVKKGLKDSVSYASEKTGELTTIGRLKMDIAGIRRKMDNNFKELGKFVYSKLEQEEGTVLATDEQAKKYVDEINELEKQLKEKEKEIEEVRKKEKEKKEQKQKAEAGGVKEGEEEEKPESEQDKTNQ